MKASAGRILYVEDDEDTRELVTCVLAMKNYKVVAAENCDDAFMLARSTQLDLYLIDNWMSERSGIDLCRNFARSIPGRLFFFIPVWHTKMTSSRRSLLVPKDTWSNPMTTMS